MGEHDQPPNQGESQPRHEESEGEDHEGPSPLDVHQSGEDVLQVTQTPAGDPGVGDVAVAVLEDGAAPDFADGSGPEGLPETYVIELFVGWVLNGFVNRSDNEFYLISGWL